MKIYRLVAVAALLIIIIITNANLILASSSILNNVIKMRDSTTPFFLWEEDRQSSGILASEVDMEKEKKKRHIILLNSFRNTETHSLLQAMITMMSERNNEELKVSSAQHLKKDDITTIFLNNKQAEAVISAKEINMKTASNKIGKNGRISGAFSMNEISGLVGEFTEDQIAFLSSHEAVRLIEEDFPAEIATSFANLPPFINKEPFQTEAILALEKGCIFGSQQNPPSWGLPALSTSKFLVASTYASYKYPIGKGKGIRAYVIDTGIDGSLPDFGNRVLEGWSIFDNGANSAAVNALDSSLVDEHGHGTHVAGIIGGKLTGVAKDVSLISVRVFREGTGPISNVIAGLAWIISQKKPGLELVNLSITSTRSLILNAMLESAWKVGLLVVSAAGNQGINACNISPAASSPWILSVGAYCENRKIASFSNRGEKCVHIYAPGCNIFSLVSGASGALLALNGTSMAAPHATGLAALLLSTPWMKERIRSSPENLKKIIVDELPFLIEDENGNSKLKALSMQYLYKFCPQTNN